MQVEHSSVLLERCVTLLTPSIEKSQSPIVVDATLGLGGHSFALLEKFPQLRIVGLDRDLKAIDKASQRLSKFSDRITVIHAVYDEMPKVLDSLGISNVDGILFDLGVSSMQLDQADRGFAYSQDAPLDMRMDQSTGPSALDILNTYSYGELVRVIRNYGEEKFATKIADNIIRLYPTPAVSVTAGLKFYFQRTPSYFTASDTTKVPGVPALLHRGFIIASVYDALLSGIGAADVGAVSVEMQKEEKKMREFFQSRNTEETPVMMPVNIDSE